MRDDVRMWADLKHLSIEPDPATLSADPKEFSLHAQMIVGPRGSLGEESFGLTVCTSEWLHQQCDAHGGIYNARHHLVVTLATFDVRKLEAWLTTYVERIEGHDWHEIGEKLGRLGYWEFEDYTP